MLVLEGAVGLGGPFFYLCLGRGNAGSSVGATQRRMVLERACPWRLGYTNQTRLPQL